MLLMHGYGEHGGRYAHVGAALARSGREVTALDARGHGRSGGAEAHVERYDEYVLDLERALDELLGGDVASAPIDLLGHSNGGLIALRYALRRPRRVRSFVITSPFCGFKIKVPAWKAAAGNVLSRLKPTFGLPSEIPPHHLTHRQDVAELYGKDPLNRSIATSRWFTETKWAQRDLLERAATITHPVLMLVAGDDQVADPRAAEAVYEALERAEPREFEVYEELYHEILNEEPWEPVMRRVLRWLDERDEGS